MLQKMIVKAIFIILAVGITMSAVLCAYVESAIKNPKKYGISATDEVITDLARLFEQRAIRIVFRVVMIALWPCVLYQVCRYKQKATE
jgi:NaMN:DMB phosphoribosyltransferase